jgi:hypothetical protein
MIEEVRFAPDSLVEGAESLHVVEGTEAGLIPGQVPRSSSMIEEVRFAGSG